MGSTLPFVYEDQGAVFDAARVYRYRLWRAWGPGDRVLWLMLNPSTADESVLDPTLRRCEGFTRRWGYDGFEVANLFALRSTDPSGLYAVPDPVGPDNDQAIRGAAERCPVIIAAWGAEPIAMVRSATILDEVLRGRRVECLGVTKGGQPRHPLYLRADQERIRYGSFM